jgi:hypothetical protein
MPSITQSGALNTTALVVPDLYVQIVPPAITNLNGVPTNQVAVVGTASWGPINTPVVVGDMAGYNTAFGNLKARKYDMGTPIATAIQQGASNFLCSRVTDATDVAATATDLNNCLTLTGLHTGSYINGCKLTISAGSKVNTWRAVFSPPVGVPELYDNIPGTANAFWVNLAAAINNGIANTSRLASAWLVATAGAGTTAPAAATYTLAGGTDGASGVTAATLVGNNGSPRTGIYVFANSSASLLVVSDADDSTQFTTIDPFALAEGMYAIQVLPSGTTIAEAVTAKQTAGLDSYATKLMHGDWLLWNDPVNGYRRFVSPQGFVAGRLANLSPEQSSLNKQLYGIIGSETSGEVGNGQLATYSTAELQQLFQAGIDVITNPIPRGAMWGVRGGINSSSNSAVNGDNYTRLTNYITETIAAGEGQYVGDVVDSAYLTTVETVQTTLFSNMYAVGMIGSVDGSLPFSVTCNTTNNPATQLQDDIVQCDIAVRYSPINAKFIVNIQGGQTVSITPQSLGTSGYGTASPI